MSLSIPFPLGWLLNKKAARVEVNISLAFLHWVEMALHPWPFVSDIAIFVQKGDVKLELTNWQLVLWQTARPSHRGILMYSWSLLWIFLQWKFSYTHIYLIYRYSMLTLTLHKAYCFNRFFHSGFKMISSVKSCFFTFLCSGFSALLGNFVKIHA